MSYDDHDKPNEELVEMFLGEHSTEAGEGLNTLNAFLGVVGYQQDRYGGMPIGNPLEDFLKDNPDAIETLIRWAGENLLDVEDDARERLIALLPPACPRCGYESEATGELCEDCAAVDAEETVEV